MTVYSSIYVENKEDRLVFSSKL